MFKVDLQKRVTLFLRSEKFAKLQLMNDKIAQFCQVAIPGLFVYNFLYIVFKLFTFYALIVSC